MEYFFFFVIIIMAVLIWAAKIYNALQRFAEAVRERNANIMAALKKRADLANRLVEIAKGYADHEKFSQVTISENLTGIGEAANVFRRTDQLINRLTAVATNFPELKADHTYGTLMSQLEAIEHDLQGKREEYNRVVKDYNTLRAQLPQALFSAQLGFPAAPYFDIEKEDDKNPLGEFQTDDGERLRARLGGAASNVLGLGQQVATAAVGGSLKVLTEVSAHVKGAGTPSNDGPAPNGDKAR